MRALLLLVACLSSAISCDFEGSLKTDKLTLQSGSALSSISLGSIAKTASISVVQDSTVQSISIVASASFEFTHEVVGGNYKFDGVDTTKTTTDATASATSATSATSTTSTTSTTSPPADTNTTKSNTKGKIASAAPRTETLLGAAVVLPLLAATSPRDFPLLKAGLITLACASYVHATPCPVQHVNIVITVPSAAAVSAIQFPDSSHVTVTCPTGYDLADNRCGQRNAMDLTASTVNQLRRLIQISTDGSEIAVARSYDGRDWEGIGASALTPDCSASGCKVGVRASHTYRIDTVDGADVPSNVQQARFLMQATFGTSKESMQDFASDPSLTFDKWIENQMAQPVNSHRTYFRQRANPRIGSLNISHGVGRVRKPCEIGSRWHRFAFNVLDIHETVLFEPVPEKSLFRVFIDSILRTEMSASSLPRGDSSRGDFSLSGNPFSFRLCKIEEFTGGQASLAPVDATCSKQNIIAIDNPVINFTTVDATMTQVFDDNDASFHAFAHTDSAVLLETLSGACDNDLGRGIVSFMHYQNKYYKYDPRLVLLDNMVEEPANPPPDMAQTCPSVPKTFLNRGSCVHGATCSSLTFESVLFELDEPTLRFWYTASSRNVHYIRGLRLEAPYDISPCMSDTSRWIRGEGPCSDPTTTLDADSEASLKTALRKSSDTNPYVRDISVPKRQTCTAGSEAIGAVLEVDGVCWTHTHPNEYDVYDFSEWVNRHDGNSAVDAANKPNPIAQFAVRGLVEFTYPTSHPMTRFESRSKFLGLAAARYGDTVNFRELQVEFQTYEMAKRVNALHDGFESCGAPGESANDPKLGHLYHFQVGDELNLKETTEFPTSKNSPKNMVWANLALRAPDQLRQKIAWALSQIFTIAEEGLSKQDEAEIWGTYYDIFIRHAFGNFRDILQEVSYSPAMGTYLTYARNRALKVSKTYPDENYAREIMQLFSIGLWQLNSDGTYKLDENGEPIATYTNDDIVTFARAWTGFDFQSPRGNVEARGGVNQGANYIDPMQLKPIWRDPFPKNKLDSGYIGDQYPLCSELPDRHFLARGAKYVLTGPTSIEGSTYDNPTSAEFSRPGRGRFTPSKASALYKALCNGGSGNGPCNFRDEVVLAQNLVCNGDECNADHINVVKMVDGDQVMYYSYHSIPCVRLTFSNGKTTRQLSHMQCANPAQVAAGATCCSKEDGKRSSSYGGECLFAGEHVTFATAEARCEAQDAVVCDVGKAKIPFKDGLSRTCAFNQFVWSNHSCNAQVQIGESGKVNVIDSINDMGKGPMSPHLALNSRSVFKVHWKDDKFPSFSTGCIGCQIGEGNSCICNTTVESKAVFVGRVPTVSEARSSLFIGAANPDSFASGVYTQSDKQDGVTVYTKVNGGDEETIFEIPSLLAGHPPIFLANRESIVMVGDSGEASMRNPPHFLPLLGEQRDKRFSSDELYMPDTQAETAAVLDYFFEHDNTGPFVCYRLIQRLVTSNPSPRYVREVVTAFQTGKYKGKTFSGKYGDMGAAVTAILLDAEARSGTVDLDPTHGRLREPLLKVISYMRAMEYKSFKGREVELLEMSDKIGQQAFEAPSVFGFYLPEYIPEGPLGQAGLVSPEAELATAPNLIGFLNGMMSFIDDGLTSLDEGFGSSNAQPRRNRRMKAETADGNFTYTPTDESPDAIIDELSLLLTGGRLDDSARKLLVDVYSSAVTESSKAEALKLVQKLVLLTPDYHSTNSNPRTGTLRPGPKATASGERKYKAIVILFLAGGADTYNMIVPHSDCKKPGYYDDYAKERGAAPASVRKEDLLTINVPVDTQPCGVFGVNPNMPAIKKLYEDGDAAFVANIGALVEPTTKKEYKAKTKQLPPSLFSHNIMQRAMHNVHAQSPTAKGVLGRVVEALTEREEPYASKLYSLTGNVKMLEGAQPTEIIDKKKGVVRLQSFESLSQEVGDTADPIASLIQPESKSLLGETFSSVLETALRQTEELGKLLDTAPPLTTTFSETTMATTIGMALNQIAKLINLRSEIGTERDVFVAKHGGYDTHNTFDKIGENFNEVDGAVNDFVKEMKAQGAWDDVVIFTVSDFGRTLTSNGLGTDHAWGGNHFVAGGKVNGKQIFGKYPERLDGDGEVSIGRGRFLPTTPWESVWSPLARWFGVEDEQLAKVLPNVGNFDEGDIFANLFES